VIIINVPSIWAKTPSTTKKHNMDTTLQDLKNLPKTLATWQVAGLSLAECRWPKSFPKRFRLLVSDFQAANGHETALPF